ncbi:PucR family transcriptional regulator [Amycolatopsis sp. cg5]|uniref:PucR family transcriptional regulator n=1 Tax=Amycolatopsis sp. cg5 TaxID=3238802 RepID=UPI00352358D7
MRLRALLDTPELGLSMLVGADALDRPFERVFTASLRDPSRYLTGGEVVLSGMQWPSPADASAFVDTLSDVGVVALGIGTAEVGGGPVPGFLVDACRAVGLPLFEVPVTVSFATITERVILGLAAERSEQGALDRHRRLVAVVTAGRGLPALVEAGAAELGADCWVLSATGRVITGTGEPPAAEHRAALARRFLLADRLPRVVTGKDGKAISLLAAASKDGHRVASWFLAVEGNHGRWDRARQEVAAEFANLVGLERSRFDETKRVENRAAEPLLRLALSEEASQAQIASRLPAAEFSATDPVFTLSASVQGGGPGLAPVIIDELFAPYRAPALVGNVDGEAFGLLRARALGYEKLDAFVAEVREAVRTIEPALGSASLAVGISRAPDAAGLHAAVHESRHARRLAELAPGRASVVAGDEVASHLLLLAAVPDELRRSFRARVLGPLLAYDAAHNSELVHTLKVFLEHSGSWTQTSAELHLHVNTLRYRVSRISELTGRDPARFADRVDLYLAGCFTQEWG